MFTIEHEFDATVVTLIDDTAPSQEDITITIFEDTVVVDQLDPRTQVVQRIALSMDQLADLRAALDLPEGAYVRKLKDR